MTTPIYIVITNNRYGEAQVATNAPMSIPSAPAFSSPAELLAATLLAQCTPAVRCFSVAFGESNVPALELARELIHPEGYGHAIRQLQPEIGQHARRVLGLLPSEEPQP